MGLDGVELVMEIEEVFGIRITHDEAQNSRTVGDVYQIILKKSAGLSAATPCMTRTAFFRLRQALLPFTPPGRSPIRPRTNLDQLIPREQRPAVWKQLEQSMGHPLPLLERNQFLSRWAGFALFAGLVSMLIAFVAAIVDDRMTAILAFATPVLGLLFALGCIVVERLFVPSDLMPAGIATVGDLAKRIKWNYQVAPDVSSLDEFQAKRKEAWEKLVEICCRTLSVKSEQVTPQAEFVRDLGLS
jgi:acyl carrier protein